MFWKIVFFFIKPRYILYELQTDHCIFKWLNPDYKFPLNLICFHPFTHPFSLYLFILLLFFLYTSSIFLLLFTPRNIQEIFLKIRFKVKPIRYETYLQIAPYSVQILQTSNSEVISCKYFPVVLLLIMCQSRYKISFDRIQLYANWAFEIGFLKVYIAIPGILLFLLPLLPLLYLPFLALFLPQFIFRIPRGHY